MDNNVWTRYWELVDRRGRTATYLNEIEGGCCEYIPKGMWRAEAQLAREQIAFLDRHIACLEPLLHKPETSDVRDSARPIRWLGTKRQLADTAGRLFDEGLIHAPNRADAVKQIVPHFVDKNGDNIGFETLRENLRQRFNNGKGELLTTSTLTASTPEGQTRK
jgi:hypothetical protein